MYVIADIEWVTTANGEISPVQLAAARVDGNWNQVNAFCSFIKPIDNAIDDWTQVAFNGGSPEDFKNANSLAEVISDFLMWLGNDTLLWWLDQSKDIFFKLASECSDSGSLPEAISISAHIYGFLKGQRNSCGSAYHIAAKRGIKVKRHLKHCSKNDVRVMRELLQTIKYPLSELLKPVVPTQPQKVEQPLLYVYDKSTNTIHSLSCENISNGDTICYPNFATALRKGYKACKCCKREYLTALRERNRDIISRVMYHYVYSADSKVFHKPTCKAILSAKIIMGSTLYKTAIDTGRTPCRICNPVPIVKPSTTLAEPKKAKPKPSKKSNSKSIKNAVARQQEALKERSERLNDSSLSERERKDVFTLTQPGYAFWSGYGYNNFHLRSCPKLKELSNLHGYRTYQEALNSGHTPCKKCKPSAKNDVVLSIPISNRQRDSESVTEIEEMCKDSGFPCEYDEEFFYLQTPVGKWAIDLVTYPVRLYHINLMVDARTEEYHTQPRVFLSLTDTFLYIKRHDESLTQKPRY
ncbi:MAG: exonuclease domain-containing protein [Oscillospiraceae bacterium]